MPSETSAYAERHKHHKSNIRLRTCNPRPPPANSPSVCSIRGAAVVGRIVVREVNNESVRVWKKSKKSRKTFSSGSQCPARVLNPALLNYESRVLPLHRCCYDSLLVLKSYIFFSLPNFHLANAKNIDRFLYKAQCLLCTSWYNKQKLCLGVFGL
jgi:hypothetical protein